LGTVQQKLHIAAASATLTFFLFLFLFLSVPLSLSLSFGAMQEGNYKHAGCPQFQRSCNIDQHSNEPCISLRSLVSLNHPKWMSLGHTWPWCTWERFERMNSNLLSRMYPVVASGRLLGLLSASFSPRMAKRPA